MSTQVPTSEDQGRQGRRERAGLSPAATEDAAGRRSAAVDEVLVLDFGGQYSQLIARRVRECGVFAELLPHHVSLDEITRRQPRGLIL